MKEKLFKRTKGFTLVELLIVIALISILAVAVLATINPIEQSNKARDARVLNDAAEVMNAIERYYASSQRYPWEVFTVNPLDTEDLVAFRSDDYGFGICKSESGFAVDANVQADGCSSDDPEGEQGELIATSELKSSFVGKDEFSPVYEDEENASQALWIMKAASDDSVYVCYIPKAKANRTVAANMRCLNETTGVVAEIGDPCLAAVDADYVAAPSLAGTVAMFKCVPE